MSECEDNRAAAIEALISATKTTLGVVPDKKVPSAKTLDSLRIRVAAFLREMPDTMTVEEILETLEATITTTEVLGQGVVR